MTVAIAGEMMQWLLLALLLVLMIRVLMWTTTVPSDVEERLRHLERLLSGDGK